MNLLTLLTKLAFTPTHTVSLNELLMNQPTEIQQAFLTQNAAALKQQLMTDSAEPLINERTVTQFN